MASGLLRFARNDVKIYLKGEKNGHRLTAHGLPYFRNLDPEIDSRN
jgi:hypothetical protein